MKPKRKVFCAGCANLLYVGGSTRPLCVATAQFVEGPLRKKVDVVDVTLAETRNLKNDCTYRESVSLRAWELKKWLLWRMNDGSNKRVYETKIGEYPVKEEGSRKRQALGLEEEYTGEEEFSEDGEESLFAVGGVDDHDERGTSDQSGGEDIQDAGDSGGLEGEPVHEVESGTDDRQ